MLHVAANAKVMFLRGMQKIIQPRIFGIYRRLMRKLLRGRFRKIAKHRFFMKYFRVFFKLTTRYEELELRHVW
jgi:hypothetical protein